MTEPIKKKLDWLTFFKDKILSWKKIVIGVILLFSLVLFHLQYYSNYYVVVVDECGQLSAHKHCNRSIYGRRLPVSDLINYHSSNGTHLGYLVNSPTCKIPDIDPFDQSILKYVKKAKKINCHIFSDVTKTKGNVLMFYPQKLPVQFHHQFTNKSNFPSFSASHKRISKKSVKEIKCCYKAVFRVAQSMSKFDKKADEVNGYSKECYPIVHEKQVVSFEVIKVQCHSKGSLIYSNVHALMNKQKMLEMRVIKTNLSSDSPLPLNVIIFGTDSVSRLNMHRALPLTVKYLKEELNAFEFSGYNKVGDNSVPNLFPLLSSNTREELQKFCMPIKRPIIFDKCNHLFIWSLFKKMGFYTSYIEDFPNTSLFHYRVDGFINPPTDKYGRSFFLESRKIKRKHNICIGNKLALETLHDYSIELLTTLKDYPTFSYFFTSEIAHNDLNMVSLADRPHASYLKRLKNTGVLNDTILFFISDHGIRFGDIRNTYVGSLEERLPMFLVVLPEWFKKKYPSSYRNMELNRNKLTSHFDTYETLIDILHSTYEEPTNNRSKRGISMFNNIPEARTCSEAGIPENFCTCQEMTPIETSEKDVQAAATLILNSINVNIKPYDMCHQFEEVIVAKAFIGSWKQKILKEGSGTKTMMIHVTVNPGNANFEATVRKVMVKKEEFKVIGDILRINTYASQLNCTADGMLRNYCICNL